MTMLRYHPVNLDRAFPNDLKQVFEKFWNANEDDQTNAVTSQWTPRDVGRQESRASLG